MRRHSVSAFTFFIHSFCFGVIVLLLGFSSSNLHAQSGNDLFPETMKLAVDTIPSLCTEASEAKQERCQRHQQKAQNKMNEVMELLTNAPAAAEDFRRAIMQAAPYVKLAAGNVIRGNDALDGVQLDLNSVRTVAAIAKGGEFIKLATDAQVKLTQVRVQMALGARQAGTKPPSVIEARKEWVSVAREAQTSMASLRAGSTTVELPELRPTMVTTLPPSSNVTSPRASTVISTSPAAPAAPARTCPPGQSLMSNGSCGVPTSITRISTPGSTGMWSNPSSSSSSLRNAARSYR